MNGVLIRSVVTSVMLVALLLNACGDGPRRRGARSDDATRSRRETPAAGAPAASTGDTIVSGGRNTIVVDGRERTFIVYVPPGHFRERPAPLVLAFHGRMGSGERFAHKTELHTVAGRDGAVVAYPDGYKRSWNDGRGLSEAEKAGVDDVAFVRALISRLDREVGIDRSRVYVTGESNGAALAFRLACELSDQIVAIAAVVGLMGPDTASKCRPSRPVSVLGIYGTADPNNPWQGRPTAMSGDRAPTLGVQATMDVWAKLAACGSPQRKETLPVTVNDGTRAWRESYAGCSRGANVVLYGVEGMGHAWPPHEPAIRRLSGSTSRNLNASEVIWSFFKGQSSARS